MMCGDFNATVDPHVDRFGCNPVSPWPNNWASTHRQLMSTFDLCDAWCARHPNVKEFTWRRTKTSQGSRIDMIWLPARYLGLVRQIEISPHLRSDHQCVYLEIDFPWGVERGPGPWKFNVSLLQHVRPFAPESKNSGAISAARRGFFLSFLIGTKPAKYDCDGLLSTFRIILCRRTATNFPG